MTKKRFLLIALLLVSVAVTLGVLAMLPPRPGVTKANFDRIQMGMTLAEVQEIFGEKGRLMDGADKFVLWETEDRSSWVDIDFLDDRLVDLAWHDATETTFNRICRWLGLGENRRFFRRL
jgi:hypothetical protein